MMAFLTIVLVVGLIFLLVLITYGMELGFRLGTIFKRSNNEELSKKGLPVQLMSILISWVGWFYALHLVEKYSVEKIDNSVRIKVRDLKWVMIALFIIYVPILLIFTIKLI